MDTLEALQSREENNPKVILRSRMEGAVIRDLAAFSHATTYVDLGCWVGLLAQQVLQGSGFRRAVMVDAVASCLKKTAEKLPPGAKAEYHQVAIVADAERRTFRVPGYDTSCAGFGQEGVPVAVTQREICAFLRSLDVEMETTYLKVDLEGLDLRIAARLAQEGMLPAALHVELATMAEYDALQALLAGRYVFPPKRPGHAFYSVALSKERSVLIGFDPDVAYV